MPPPNRAPFPYFGGKSRIAPVVWRLLGEPRHYVEPFLGSAAVLLHRPEGRGLRTETVNDADGYLANVWRAIRADPAGVAEWAQAPVSAVELEARGRWLRDWFPGSIDWLRADVDAFDSRAAGYWIYGQCASIGQDWMRAKPSLDLGRNGNGINRQSLHLGDSGRGVNAGDRRASLRAWLRGLSARLLPVRIHATDWATVCTPAVLQATPGPIGVFLDPPYPRTDGELYAHADASVFHLAAAWAAENGDRYRIVLCGEEGDWAPPPGWQTVEWKRSSRGYSGQAKVTAPGKPAAKAPSKGHEKRERLWASPQCAIQRDMFDAD